MANLLMALDLSFASTGYAVLGTEVRNGELAYHLVEGGVITRSRAANPLLVLQFTIREVVSRYPTLNPVIPKEALISRNYQTTRILKNVHNAARSALPGFDLVNVNPTSVKKMIGARGNATKKEVAAGVRRICGLPVNYRFATDDVSDAAGVGLCYLMMNEYKLAMLLP